MGSDLTAETGNAEPTLAASCSTCFRPIDPRARKCVDCGSYQDWRRHLAISSSVLALLVALVSVLAFAVPIFVQALTPKDSKLNVRYQGTVNGHLYLMATNEGNRAGSVTNVMMNTISVDKGKSEVLFENDLEFKPIVVEPGESKQIALPISEENYKMITTAFWVGVEIGGIDNLKIQFALTYSDFAGTSNKSVHYTPPMTTLLTSAPDKWSRCLGDFEAYERTHVRKVPVKHTVAWFRQMCGPEPDWAKSVKDERQAPQSKGRNP